MLETPEVITPGLYLAGRDEEGILLFLAVRNGGADLQIGAILVDLGGAGMLDVVRADGVTADLLLRRLIQPFDAAGIPLQQVAGETAGARLAVAERVAERRGHELPDLLPEVYALLDEDTHQVRRRTRRQLEEEEALAALPPTVLRKVLAQRLEVLYARWAEDPAPTLGGLTPLEAWQDPQLKPRVEELLDRVAQLEEIRLRGIGIAFDAQRLRLQLTAPQDQPEPLRAVESEISDILLLARVPASSRLQVYQTWWRLVAASAPAIEEPRTWAAALYRVMAPVAHLVPLSWEELERLFEIDREATKALAVRLSAALKELGADAT